MRFALNHEGGEVEGGASASGVDAVPRAEGTAALARGADGRDPVTGSAGGGRGAAEEAFATSVVGLRARVAVVFDVTGGEGFGDGGVGVCRFDEGRFRNRASRTLGFFMCAFRCAVLPYFARRGTAGPRSAHAGERAPSVHGSRAALAVGSPKTTPWRPKSCRNRVMRARISRSVDSYASASMSSR